MVKPSGEPPSYWPVVVEARLAVEHADRELVQTIMDARGAGMSLRAIADAAGVSHEKVRQILQV